MSQDAATQTDSSTPEPEQEMESSLYELGGENVRLLGRQFEDALRPLGNIINSARNSLEGHEQMGELAALIEQAFVSYSL